MYRRQSVYNSSQENVSLNALAAASALGRVLSPDGREVDRSKIPFYNSSSRAASMANLSRSSSMTNKHGSHLNSITRHNSMYVSVNEVSQRQEKRRIVIPSFKKTIKNNSRRTSSLPSSSSDKRNHNKVTAAEARNVHKTFQEFGGPQTVTINSISNKRTIKKYIPGPNGLIAIDVPVDDDIKRRQRGSYSLTTSYLDARNPHGKNNCSSRSNNGLHHHHHNNNNNNNNNNSTTHPRICTRISSDSLTNHSSRNNNTNNNKSTSSINKNPYQKGDLTLNKQRSTSSLTSNSQSKSTNNIISGHNKHIKTNVTNPKVIHHREISSKDKIAASILHSSKETVKDNATVPLSMIESSMPEETELELELDLGNVESPNLKQLDTPSNIELNELMEETIELEEKLNEDFILDVGLEAPNINDAITNEQDSLSDQIIYSDLSNDNKITLGITNTALQIDNNMDNDISDLDSTQKDNLSQTNEKISITSHSDTHIRDNGIEESSNDLLHISNKSDVSSLFYEEEDIVNRKIENINAEKFEEDAKLIVSSDKSENKTYDNEDINLLGNQVDKDKEKKKVVNEKHNYKIEIIDKLVTDELPQKQVEQLDLQITNHPDLEGDQTPENFRDGSSDYVSTEEYPNVNTSDVPILPPISAKRHREGVHSVRNNFQDALTDTKTTTEYSPSRSEDIFNGGPQQVSDHSQNKENIAIKKNRTTMADYLRSANPYLIKKDNVNVKTQNNIIKKGTYSTPKKKVTRSPSLSLPSEKPIKKHSVLSNDLKPPPRLSQNVTPIKSALKKTQSYNSDSSVYNDNPANDAYLSLTTAENTRLNARMSNENLVSRKVSVRKAKRPQSTVTQVAQRPQSPLSKDNKKKSAVIVRHSSVIRNSKSIDNSKMVKQRSKIEPTKTVNTHEDLVITKAKKLAQDPRTSSILYPIESISKKSSFEKLRPEINHLGFKSLSLRTDMINEAEYEQSNISNKFHQNKVPSSYPVNQQQRTQQMQPLTATIGYGASSGWISRFQDSDSDDDYTSQQYIYSKSNRKGGASSSKMSSPPKLNSNGFSLFKNKKHHDLQEQPDKLSYETPNLSNNTKFDKIPMRTISATDQLTPTNRSGQTASQERIFSEPQPTESQKIHDYQNIEDGNHMKTHNKFGNKLKKLFGRKK